MSPILQSPFLLPSYVFSNGQVTGNSWSNPNNLLQVDGKVATSNPNSAASDVTIGYSFSFPTNAIITGVELKVIGYSGASTTPPITLTPLWYDNTNPLVPAYYNYTPPFTGFTPTLATYLLGSPTYLFASSISYVQANNFKLNLVANGNISLDSVLVSFFYYVPVTPTPPPPPGPSCVDCNSPIQVQDLYLAQPFKANDRYMYLTNFNYADGTPVNYADLGSCGGFIDFVIDPELSKLDPTANGKFAENTVTAIWSYLPNGQVQFDYGVQTNTSTTRGLLFHTPYTAVPTLRSDHDVGARVVISDNGPFLGQLLRQCQADVVFSVPIEVDYNSTSITPALHRINFTGGGQFTYADPFDTDHDVIVYIPGNMGPASSSSATSANIQVPSLTFNVTSLGIDRIIVVKVSTEQLQTITGITFNSVALTQEVVAIDIPNNLRSEIWTLIAPSVGTFPLIITLSGVAYISAGADIYTGIDQVAPIGTSVVALGTSASPTLSITPTNPFSILTDTLSLNLGALETYTANVGQTIDWSFGAAIDKRQQVASSNPQGQIISAQTPGYTLGTSTNWAYAVLELKTIESSIGGGIKSINADTTPAQTLVAGPGTTITDLGGGAHQISNSTSGQAMIQFDDQLGNPLGTPGTVNEVEVTGPGVTGARTGNKVTYTLSPSLAPSNTQTIMYPVESVIAGSSMALTKTVFGSATTALPFGKVTADEQNAFAVYGSGIAMTQSKMALKSSIVAGIVFDASGGNAVGRNVDTATLTWAHTIGVGSNRILVVEIGDAYAPQNVTGVTFNTIPMIQITATANYVTLWYLVNPPVGTFNVVATRTVFGAGDPFSGQSASYFGVDQIAPIDSIGFNTGSSNPLTVSTTVVGTGCWLIGAGFVGVNSNDSCAWTGLSPLGNDLWVTAAFGNYPFSHGTFAMAHSTGTVAPGVQSRDLHDVGTTPEFDGILISLLPATIDNIIIRIETDNVGVPSGILANANAHATISGSTMTTSFVDTAFSWAGAFTLTAGVPYWVRLSRSGSLDDSFYYESGYDASGARVFSVQTYDGATWTSIPNVVGYVEGFGFDWLTMSDSSLPTSANFVGLADAIIALGASGPFVTDGVSNKLSALTPNQIYQIGTAGSVVPFSFGGLKIGKALTANLFQIVQPPL